MELENLNYKREERLAYFHKVFQSSKLNNHKEVWINDPLLLEYPDLSLFYGFSFAGKDDNGTQLYKNNSVEGNLSPKALDIYNMLKSGKNAKQIMLELNISFNTLMRYCGKIAEQTYNKQMLGFTESECNQLINDLKSK